MRTLEVFLWITVNCIVKQNIVRNKVKFKINHTSMNDYNYNKLQQITAIFESGWTPNLLNKSRNNS